MFFTLLSSQALRLFPTLWLHARTPYATQLLTQQPLPGFMDEEADPKRDPVNHALKDPSSPAHAPWLRGLCGTAAAHLLSLSVERDYAK